MKCPVCVDKDLLMSSRDGVEIDYCPNCRGVWLDRGELDKIIERNEKSSDGYENEKYPRDYNDNKSYQNKPYKKKNILGELFDF